MSWVGRRLGILRSRYVILRPPITRRTSGLASAEAHEQFRIARRNGVIAYFVLGTLGAVYLFWPSEPVSKNRNSLSPTYFSPVTVASTESTSPDTKLLTLTLPPRLRPSQSQDPSVFSPIWSIYIKDDDLQVERPYTPLEGIDAEGHMRLWIKKYPKGEVGRWLHSKNVGDTINIRGPLTTWPWKEDAWDEVIMISGGTGITPFYQLLYHVFSKDPSVTSSGTRFTLLHSSRNPAELPPQPMLQTLQSFSQTHPDRLALHLFVDSLESPTDRSKAGLDLQVHRIGTLDIQQSLGMKQSRLSWWSKLWGSDSSNKTPDIKQRKVLFLVCGPDQMISAIAGPPGRNQSQGKVGGVLGEMGCTSDQVWKL